MPPKVLKKEEIKYKDIITVGEVGVSASMPETLMVPKVKCNLALLRDIHTCYRCPFNKGMKNQYIMRCTRKKDEEVPTFADHDYDLEKTSTEAKNYGDKK